MKRINFSIHLMNFLRFKECGSMIKKFLNVVFMCIGLLMQSFLFVIPVMAEEVKEPTLKINGIYQGDNLAKIDEDGNYIIDKYNKVILDFELENINV